MLPAIRQYGIAVIDGSMPLATANEAGEALRAFTPENCRLVPAAHGSRGVLLASRHLANAKASHRSLSFTPEHSLIAAASDDFHGDKDWENVGLYGLVYLDARKGDVSYHIDPSACLKALVYLTDVDSEATGRFLDIGSHREGFFRMMCHYYEGAKRAYEVPDNELRSPAKVLGKAGTCILFNSILIHRAGEIASGHKRLSLTYFFDRADADDSDMSKPPWRYARPHQSEERPYIQE